MIKNIMIYSEFDEKMQFLFDKKEQLEGIKVAVAVSGGSDSMALCLLMNNWIKRFNGELFALTIDHGLREESHLEAKKVHNILSNNGINHRIINWIGPKPTSNIQEEARIARYNLLTEYCLNNKIKYLSTGHQKNDQAENFLIRLERGSGIYGLSGIPKITEFNGIHVIRPLLTFTKNQLQEFLKRENVRLLAESASGRRFAGDLERRTGVYNGVHEDLSADSTHKSSVEVGLYKKSIEWVEDPSNQNDKFTRVRMRNILNQYPEFIDNFAAISDNLAQVKLAIEYYVNLNIKELVISLESNIVSFAFDKFNILPQEIRFRMLEKLLQQVSNNKKPARGERIASLLDKILMAKDFKAATLSDCLIMRKKNLILIRLENK